MEFSYDDIAALKGVKAQTVRTWFASVRANGRWQRGIAPGAPDLIIATDYLSATFIAGSRQMKDEEVAALMEDDVESEKYRRELSYWRNRYPRYALFTCAFKGCDDVLVGPGLCSRHGWGARPIIFSPYFELVVEAEGGGRKYVPYHRLVLGEPAGLVVHHKDRNRWNNRVDNLAVMTLDEHRAHHQWPRKTPEKGSFPSLPEGKTPDLGSFPALPMPANHDESSPTCTCRRCFS